MNLAINNYSVKTPAFRANLDDGARKALYSGVDTTVAKVKVPVIAKLIHKMLDKKISKIDEVLSTLEEGTIYLSDDIGKREKALKLSFIGPHKCLDVAFPKKIQDLTITDTPARGMGCIIRNSRKVLQFPSSGLNWLLRSLKKI